MAHKTTNLHAARQASKAMQRRSEVQVEPVPASTVQPKPLAPAAPRAELSRSVRIALDALSVRGLSSPRTRHTRPSGIAPFICG